MASILEKLREHPIKHLAAGETLIAEGDRSGLLFVLIKGRVEVVKGDVVVATSAEPGAVFGELSVLLEIPHTAAVRVVEGADFYVVENPRAFFESSPHLCIHICEVLARRLDAVTKYLVDVKHQYEGHDHLGMVDCVLDTLLHRMPRKRVAPRESSLRDPEVLD